MDQPRCPSFPPRASRGCVAASPPGIRNTASPRPWRRVGCARYIKPQCPHFSSGNSVIRVTHSHPCVQLPGQSSLGRQTECEVQTTCLLGEIICGCKEESHALSRRKVHMRTVCRAGRGASSEGEAAQAAVATVNSGAFSLGRAECHLSALSYQDQIDASLGL